MKVETKKFRDDGSGPEEFEIKKEEVTGSCDCGNALISAEEEMSGVCDGCKDDLINEKNGEDDIS